MVCPGLILTHQAAEAHHIGVENGGKFPLPGGRGLRIFWRDIGFRSRRNGLNLAVGTGTIFDAVSAGHGSAER